MTIQVDHPVLGLVEFPDSATPEQINATLLQIGTAVLPESSSGDAFFNQLGEGLESSIEGISNLTGLDFYEDSYEDEFRNRVQLEQSPYAGYGGLLVGSILDPVTLPAAFLKPITLGSKVATGVARGGIVGAAGGGVEPVFEEFGDSRLLNTTVGAAFGGALGGALSKFIARDVTPPTKQDIDDGVDSALEGVAEAVEAPRVKTPEEARQDVEVDLTERSKLGLTPDAEQTLQKGIDERLKKVEQIEKASAKRTKGLRSKEDKAQAQKALDRFDTTRTRLMDEVREMRLRIKKGQEGRAAGAELAKLRTGQTDKLSPETQTALNPEPVVRPPKPTDPSVAVAKAGAEAIPVERIDADEEEFAPVATGLKAEESVGAMGVDPSRRYAGQAAEGVDETELISSAWSRRNVEPAKSRNFEESDQDLRRLKMREDAAYEQIERLKGHKRGPYTLQTNEQAEQDALDAIGEDFDSLVDFVIRQSERGRPFSAMEARVLEPLRAEIEQNILITYKTMRKMRAEGSFRTTEYTQDEYDAVMDLQFYSYLANAIDTNGTRASHSLKELQAIKQNRQKNAAKIKAGKPIDDIFGVKC